MGDRPCPFLRLVWLILSAGVARFALEELSMFVLLSFGFLGLLAWPVVLIEYLLVALGVSSGAI